MSGSAGARAMYRDPHIKELVREFQSDDALWLISELDMLGLNHPEFLLIP